MERARYLHLARRWWWLLVLGVFIGGGAAYGVSQLITPIYRASATLLVNQTQTPGTIAYNDVLASERLTKTYRELITKRPVLVDAIDSLNLTLSPDELQSFTDVEAVRDTQLLRVSVEHPVPSQASLLANAVTQAFINANEEDQISRPGSVAIVELAETPDSPILPRTTLNTALGAVVGLLLAGILALAYEYLDDTVKSAVDVEAATGLATLGAVARFSRIHSVADGLVVGSPRHVAAAEAYKVLRTNVQFSTLDQPAHAMLVSSASPGEGKTTTVANLGLAIAQTGQRVVLVDADLRRPSLHRVFGLPNRSGLTNALLSREPELPDFLQATRFENLWVVTSGPLPPNPSELLSSSRLNMIIQGLRNWANIIIFDSPPTLAVADASILAGKVDAAIMVVNAAHTRVHALQQAIDALSRSKKQILGVVLNKLSRRDWGYYYHSYYYAADDGTNGPQKGDSSGGRKAKRRPRATRAGSDAALRPEDVPLGGLLAAAERADSQ